MWFHSNAVHSPEACKLLVPTAPSSGASRADLFRPPGASRPPGESLAMASPRPGDILPTSWRRLRHGTSPPRTRARAQIGPRISRRACMTRAANIEAREHSRRLASPARQLRRRAGSALAYRAFGQVARAPCSGSRGGFVPLYFCVPRPKCSGICSTWVADFAPLVGRRPPTGPPWRAPRQGGAETAKYRVPPPGAARGVAGGKPAHKRLMGRRPLTGPPWRPQTGWCRNRKVQGFAPRGRPEAPRAANQPISRLRASSP